jgi:hypothetical protein
MVSTVTRHHAEAGLKALSLGAADYVPKPESGAGSAAAADFRRGAAAQAGLCSAVLPLDQIAAKIAWLFAGERR